MNLPMTVPSNIKGTNASARMPSTLIVSLTFWLSVVRSISGTKIGAGSPSPGFHGVWPSSAAR